jgi:hypothetical protein
LVEFSLCVLIAMSWRLNGPHAAGSFLRESLHLLQLSLHWM